jgi:hypothetical protein
LDILFLVIVVGVVAGFVGYAIGDSVAYKRGYGNAQTVSHQLIRKAYIENTYLHNENAKISHEKGSLRKEVEILTNIVRQQPTTPEAETILKALGRVQFQLTQLLPSALEDGEGHDSLLN